jgi:tricorn protease-like protein
MRKRLRPSTLAIVSASLVVVPALAGVAAATAPGANGQIAYVSNRDGHDEIYAINPDGTGGVDLSQSLADEIDPAYSPGGTKIAYVSNRDGNWDIWQMYADGSHQTQITAHSQSDRYPTWSPDGTKIAYRSNAAGNFDIHVMNADGTGDRVIAGDGAFDSEPAWSPDGQTIAFVSERATGQREVWAVNADGANPRRLTSQGANRFPSWSPDGLTISFISDRDGYEQLYAMSADGSNQRRMLVSHHSDRYPVYSPDGGQVAFRSSNIRAQQAIFLMNADGTNVHQITADSARDIQPSWQTIPVASTVVEPPIRTALPTGGPTPGSGSSPAGGPAGSLTGGTLGTPGGTVARLAISRLRAAPTRFASAMPVACATHPATNGCRAARTHLGTSLRFTLTGRARVSFTLSTRVHGKKRVLASFLRTGTLGANRVRFAGRLHGRALANGGYTITAVAGRTLRQSLPASVRVAVRNH